MSSDESLPAVSTAEAKATATEEARKSLQEIAQIIIPLRDRDEQKSRLEELKKTAHPDAQTFLKVTTLREKQHYWFMQRLLPQVPEINMNGREHSHDYTKDDLFFFAAPCFFDGGLTNPENKEFMLKELKHHYVHEPHHPEWENYNDGKECTEGDIVEMAIDRLARNVQFGNGIVDIVVMGKFKPKFPLGDNEAKQAHFWEHVLKYKDFVQREFHAMYPNTKEWANI